MKLNDIKEIHKKLLFKNIIAIIIYGALSVYTILTFPYFNKKATFSWVILCYSLSMIFGISACAHRLWSHSTYKAKWPLRMILTMFYYTTGQFKLYMWVKLHRVHHKYSDTVADPMNAKRGMFFSYVGWTIMEKHPECTKRLREIDISDIKSDPFAKFGDRFYIFAVLTLAIILPSLVPVFFWNECWYWSIKSQVFIRLFLQYQVVSFGNALLHTESLGTKSHNRNLKSVNSRLYQIIAFGEGYHNYHHVFPYDYKCEESTNSKINVSARFIELMAKFGLAYDLKQPSKELVKITWQKLGDGTHPLLNEKKFANSIKNKEK